MEEAISVLPDEESNASQNFQNNHNQTWVLNQIEEAKNNVRQAPRISLNQPAT